MLAPDCARQGGRSIGWRIVLTPNGKEQFAGLNNIVATAGDVRFGNRTVMLAGALGELEVEHIVTNVVPIVTTDPREYRLDGTKAQPVVRASFRQ